MSEQPPRQRPGRRRGESISSPDEMIRRRSQLRAKAAMPTDVTPNLSFFDRFATTINRFVSRAWFFMFCLLLVVVWVPSYLVLRNVDTWQLIINTLTTIITFLLVALLQNTQTRADNALQHKLNGIADALGDLMTELSKQYPELGMDVAELDAAVGLEERESS